VRGYDLVALIFVREVNDPLTSLVKRLDKEMADAVPNPKGLKRGVFVIYCNDSPQMGDQLKALVAKETLQRIVLCSTNAEGPKRYTIAREADTTVVIYNPGRTVETNLVLKKGALTEAKADVIAKGISEMLRRPIK
jgi:hypothetical protein